jgi:chaperonin cofactor prefoldin
MLDTYELRDSIVMLKRKLEDLETEVISIQRQREALNQRLLKLEQNTSNTSRAFGNSGSVGYSSVERSSGT